MMYQLASQMNQNPNEPQNELSGLEESEIFKSAINDDDNRPTIYLRPNRMSRELFTKSCREQSLSLTRSQQVHPMYSQLEPLLPQSNPLIQTELVRSIEQIQYNKKMKREIRVQKILKRDRPEHIQVKEAWSWDTSASLIKLMGRRKWARVLMNFYIISIFLIRVYYITLFVVYSYFLNGLQENEVLKYGVMGSFVLSRIIYMLVIRKILYIGEYTKDKKIKNIYETYLMLFDEFETKYRGEQAKRCLIEIRNINDQELYNQITNRMKRLQRWLIILKTYIILVPPEFSFFYIGSKKQTNGFFQLQNYIMKSVETYFFLPFFIWFLFTQESGGIFKIFVEMPELQLIYITRWVIFIDLMIFLILVLILLLCNQRRSIVKIKY
ncbi:hypothetical protein pb186bvf_004578 [Paramecium bursaria]